MLKYILVARSFRFWSILPFDINSNPVYTINIH